MSVDNDMDNAFKTRSASVSDRGLSEKRPENEDSFLEMPQSGIFAVADGVGGAQAGEVASQMAMEILGEAFAHLPSSADAEDAMRAAFERANSAIFQMAHELPQLATMATTIVALHLDGNIATIGHVGDSRLYRVDRSGEIYRETDDHSVVAEEVRAGRMTEEQAENHPSKNIISRAIGAEATVEPDLKTMMVEPGTAFMLCSDGVTRHVGDQEIKGVLTFGGSPREICDYIKELCYQRGAEDNLTAVVVKVGSATGPLGADRPRPPVVESEEPTIATARVNASPQPAAAPPTPPAPVADDEPELDLDLDELFQQVQQPLVSNDRIEIVEPEEEYTPKHVDDELEDEVDDQAATVEISGVDAPPVPEREAEAAAASDFRMFGADADVEEPADKKSSGLGVFASSLAMLVLGSIIGIGIYHFIYVRPQLQQLQQRQDAIPPITEMESKNQQLSAFEENRRTVDLHPAEALTQFGASPADAEDYFLVGRAHMLLGQYPEAKKAFMDARSHISSGDVDQNNKKTLETEIAIAMSVLNDTTVQTILKSQLNPGNTNTAATPSR